MGRFAPLANDERGVAFELPNDAEGWRVTAATGKKGPGKVMRNNGLPIQVPIDASVEDFCELLEDAGHSVVGRFRLTAVDDQGAECEDTSVAVLEFDDEAAEPAPERRNAAPVEMAAPQYKSEFQIFLSTVKEGNDNLLTAVKDLVASSRERDTETLKTLREALRVSTESNNEALKALARAHAGPVAYDVPATVVEEVEPAPAAETSSLEVAQKFMEAMPQIMQLVTLVKEYMPASAAAPAAPIAGAAASGHVNGVNGAHS